MKLGIFAASMLIGAASLLSVSAFAQTKQSEQTAKTAMSASNVRAETVDSAKSSIVRALPVPQNAIPNSGALPDRKWGAAKNSAVAPMTSGQATGAAIPPAVPLQ